MVDQGTAAPRVRRRRKRIAGKVREAHEHVVEALDTWRDGGAATRIFGAILGANETLARLCGILGIEPVPPSPPGSCA